MGTKCLFVAVVILFASVASAQMILNPSAYDVSKSDISLDSTPKCQSCRHIIQALRNHFVSATSLSPTSIIYEADPCSMSPQNQFSGWCSDVYKKLTLCPSFIQYIFDRSYTAVKICESCGYDQFPLPPVRFCDNSIYMNLEPANDKCFDCMDMVRRIQGVQEPCERMTKDSCEELQNNLAHCDTYNRFIQQPFIIPRRICEECSADQADGSTNPPGMTPNMYCDRPVPSPILDDSTCSLCVNIVYNQRSFPMDSPCRGMPDEQCSYIQDRLMQCTVYNRMLDQHVYSALSICEECTDNKNPLAPVKFCASQARVGNARGVFDLQNPQQVGNYNPGAFNQVQGPFLKAEPPAAFAQPWWLKQQPAFAEQPAPVADATAAKK